MIGSEIGEMREKAEIDSKNARFPYCIVWTPLPCITWLIPPIGHMGIAYSTGVIRDFAGPYYVSEDNLAFGSTTRYLQLEPELIKGKFDIGCMSHDMTCRITSGTSGPNCISTKNESNRISVKWDAPSG